MYAIIGLFDQPFEQNVKKIWSELCQRGLSTYAYEVKNRAVHLTLASFEVVDEHELILALKNMAVQNQIHLQFHSVGTFLGSQIVYLAPIKSKSLTKLQQVIHDICPHHPASFYLPDCWVPHVTLANRVSIEKLAETYFYCSQNSPLLHAQLGTLQFIKIDTAGQVRVIYQQKLSP